MPSEDLHKPLKAINKSIAKLRQDVQKLTGGVEKVHTAVKEAAETIRDAIHENIRAQAELKLMEHVMEVRSVGPQIEAEHEQIRAEREELEERLEAIGERYERRQAELDRAAEERIRNLGEHIFAIDEEQFEAGVEEPFTDLVTPTWRTLRWHNEAVHEERNERVEGTTDEVVETIHDFVDRQDALVESIRDYRLDPAGGPLPVDRPDRLQVPYYVVEYEVDGVAEREVVVPSEVSTDDDAGWCRLSLEPIAGAEDLLGGVSGVTGPVRTDALDSDDLAAALEPYGDDSLLVRSYGEAIADALPEEGSIPVRVAEGEA